MRVIYCEQRSPEWWEIRKGLPTASIADKLMTPTGKKSTQSKGIIGTFVAEALGLQDPPPPISTYWMERGINLEEETARWFELEMGFTLTQCGFILNEDGTAGCSPDGLVVEPTEENGVNKIVAGFEGKAPKPSTHIQYLIEGVVPKGYLPQIDFSMAVSGLRTWWFISYSPGLPALILPVHWSEKTDLMVQCIRDFCGDLAEAKKTFGGLV